MTPNGQRPLEKPAWIAKWAGFVAVCFLPVVLALDAKAADSIAASFPDSSTKSLSSVEGKSVTNIAVRTPASFIENKGQWDPRVRYQLSNGGKAIWLTGSGLVFDTLRSKSLLKIPARSVWIILGSARSE